MLCKKMIIPAILASTFLSVNVLAVDGEWKLKPGVLGSIYDNKREYQKDELGGSLGLEYQYGRWGTEIQLFSSDTEDKLTKEDIDVLGASINQYRYFNLDSALQPYVVFGVGHADFDGQINDQKETFADIGLGFQHRLTDNLGWWFDVKGVHGFDDSTTDALIGLGVSISFGGANNQEERLPVVASTPVIVEAPRDSDSDGVVDSKDQCPNTLADTKVDSSGCKLKVTRVEEVRLNVLFELNSSQIQPSNLAGLEKLAGFMTKHNELDVILEGHTDSTGADAYNQTMSLKRTQSVKELLVNDYVINAERISVKGYGESMPVTKNDSKAGRAMNRRVIAVLTKTITE
jgi:OOP family OmpA-OmpF porin